MIVKNIIDEVKNLRGGLKGSLMNITKGQIRELEDWIEEFPPKR